MDKHEKIQLAMKIASQVTKDYYKNYPRGEEEVNSYYYRQGAMDAALKTIEILGENDESKTDISN